MSWRNLDMPFFLAARGWAIGPVQADYTSAERLLNMHMRPIFPMLFTGTMSKPRSHGSFAQLRGQCFPPSDQLTDGSSLHLAHHVATMKLDGDFTDTQIERNLLVDASPRDFVQDFALTRRQRPDRKSNRLNSST